MKLGNVKGKVVGREKMVVLPRRRRHDPGRERRTGGHPRFLAFAVGESGVALVVLNSGEKSDPRKKSQREGETDNHRGF